VKALTRAGMEDGVRLLCARDPDLRDIRRRLGTPPLWARRPGFAALVRIILEQQVSLAAARTMYRRLASSLGGMSPALLQEAGEAGLRELGLTRQKARYCCEIAARLRDGRLDLSAVAALPDHDGRAALLSVPGLGPWSVDIYYLMALRRPDVWPEGDLALAAALKEVKGLSALPSREEQRELAARWSPWRSVAARLLWARYLDARGQYTPPA
jgi:DNA-3-methyladenine glycosylase II